MARLAEGAVRQGDCVLGCLAGKAKGEPAAEMLLVYRKAFFRPVG